MLIVTWEVTGPFPSYYYFSTLLIILQVRDSGEESHLQWSGARISRMFDMTYVKVHLLDK